MKPSTGNYLSDYEKENMSLKQIAYAMPSTNTTPTSAKLYERLKDLKVEEVTLDKQRASSGLQRNFIYPLAMLLLLLLTSITVLLVFQNTIELLIGIKALPLSSRVRILFSLVFLENKSIFFVLQQFLLGISSLSVLGPFGAALEVCIIMYLGVTSAVGLYTMPFMAKIRPTRRKTSLTQLIANSALILLLTSALPLLSRILGNSF